MIAEASVTAFQLYCVREDIDIKKVWKENRHYLLVGACMFGVVYGLSVFLTPSIMHTLFIISVGVVIYFVILFILKDKYIYTIMQTVKDKLRVKQLKEEDHELFICDCRCRTGRDHDGRALGRTSSKNILLIEKRNHIGGNVYDSYNEDGILIHNYGPHIFHTNNKEVFDYLSNFTEWIQYQHHVLSFVDGRLLPMPIGVETINSLYNLHLSVFEFAQFIEQQREKRTKIETSEDVALDKVGRDIYEKFFKNYTIKQWGTDPSELDTSVISRIPLRFNRDTRYFADQYQGMPRLGYTKMCENMLKSKHIHILLNTDYRDVLDGITYDTLIYTGPVDAFYQYKYGN